MTITCKLPHCLENNNLSRNKTEIVKSGAEAICRLIKNHFNNMPAFYDPNKVNYAIGDRINISIDVPGISRAFHPLDIYAKRAKALTIPMDKKAKGHSPREFSNLFVWRSKRTGNAGLGYNNGKNLVAMYVFKDHVHQNQDPSLLPTLDEMKNAAVNAMTQKIMETIKG